MDNLDMRAHALTMLYLQQQANAGALQLLPAAYTNEYKRIYKLMLDALKRN